MATSDQLHVLELDSRTSDGLTVTLLYRPKVRKKADRITLRVEDHGQTLETIVPPAMAHDAFHHPFIYVDATAPADEPEQDEPIHVPAALKPTMTHEEWRRAEGLEGDDPVAA